MTNNESRIYPVILSGGSGTRLWPLSREQYPKQLLALTGERTLLQETVLRLDGADRVSNPLFVCNEEHRFLVAEQVRQLGKSPLAIVLEPTGRNTAPALTLAALVLKRGAGDPIMLVMPADHNIRDSAAFRESVKKALPLAAKGRLVTFGVKPTAPATGYGYIKRGKGNDVAAFVEKPDVATAKLYVDSGEYAWNSGMFMVRLSTWFEELRRFEPEIARICEAAHAKGKNDGDFFRIDKETFARCPSNSIDYAVMEKTDRAAIVELDAGWSDVGAWSSLWESGRRDASGNVVSGDVYAHDTRDALLISQHRLLAVVGLDDIIVVETPDAVLVSKKERAQEVKEIVARLKAEGRSEHQVHRRVYRPWGSYEGVDAGSRFQVKRLSVKPGAALSLQMHHHRAEHWVVVQGTARVTRGDEVFTLTENQSTYIPVGTKHRLENPGNIQLEIIEVQSGGYLGEDDIVRFEDVYNRQKEP
jgi:mannose-1-phosphate guanylyltransferase / mannose-6-phosphate isomerase